MEERKRELNEMKEELERQRERRREEEEARWRFERELEMRRQEQRLREQEIEQLDEIDQNMWIHSNDKWPFGAFTTVDLESCEWPGKNRSDANAFLFSV